MKKSTSPILIYWINYVSTKFSDISIDVNMFEIVAKAYIERINGSRSTRIKVVDHCIPLEKFSLPSRG